MLVSIPSHIGVSSFVEYLNRRIVKFLIDISIENINMRTEW